MSKLFWFFCFSYCCTALAMQTTPTGIPLDAAWKVRLNEFALKSVVHQSWGYPHAERNYQNTVLIAKAERAPIDLDVLFAAAFLHDLGGLAPHEKPGEDHAERSAELAIPLLRSFGFPEDKLADVKEVILGHVYYGPVPEGQLARFFRDADILDFLGSIGWARLMAATPELGETPALSNTVKVIRSLMERLPDELSTVTAKKASKPRVREMRRYLKSIELQTFTGKAI